jgi:hypothetical protein
LQETAGATAKRGGSQQRKKRAVFCAGNLIRDRPDGTDDAGAEQVDFDKLGHDLARISD